MAVNNSLAGSAANKVVPFSQTIQTEGYQKLLNSAIADKEQRNRFVTAVISAVSASPNLQKCDAKTILSSALQGEALQLSPSPSLGEYAIVPYGVNWNADKQEYESYKAQFQIMTNGRVQLAMRSGQFTELDAFEVRQGEYKGKESMTGKPIIKFISDDDERETLPIVGYYAYFKLINGFFKSVYFSKAKVIDHATKYSKAFNYDLYVRVMNGEKLNWKEEKKADTPWIKHFDQMALNLVLREVLKKAPKSIEMRGAVEIEDSIEADIATSIMAPAPVPALTQEEVAEDFFGEDNEEDAPEKEEPKKRGRKPASQTVVEAPTDFDDDPLA